MEKQQRLEKANQLITLIAESGRQFFNYTDYNDKGGTISHFKLKNNRLYFVDGYTKKEIYAYANGPFRCYFSDGGTMRAFILDLSEYIRTGKATNSKNGYGGVYCAHWGYPENDMKKVREKALEIGFTKGRTIDYEKHKYIT